MVLAAAGDAKPHVPIYEARAKDFEPQPLSVAEHEPTPARKRVPVDDVEELCHDVWNPKASEADVLVKGYNMVLTRHDLLTLKRGNWLNDEVVNFYFSMMKERADISKEYPAVCNKTRVHSNQMMRYVFSAVYIQHFLLFGSKTPIVRRCATLDKSRQHFRL